MLRLYTWALRDWDASATVNPLAEMEQLYHARLARLRQDAAALLARWYRRRREDIAACAPAKRELGRRWRRREAKEARRREEEEARRAADAERRAQLEAARRAREQQARRAREAEAEHRFHGHRLRALQRVRALAPGLAARVPPLTHTHRPPASQVWAVLCAEARWPGAARRRTRETATLWMAAAAEWVETRRRLHAAAATIQRGARCMLGRTLARRERRAAERREKLARQAMARARSQTLARAFQAWFTRWRIWRHVRGLMERGAASLVHRVFSAWKEAAARGVRARTAAALRLQCWARTCAARRELARRASSRRRRLDEAEAAATRARREREAVLQMQQWLRNRKRFAAARARRERLRQARHQRRIASLQHAWSSWMQARRALRAEIHGSAVARHEAQRVARSCLRAWREHTARGVSARAASALHVQRVWRGRCGRRRVRRARARHNAAVAIQSVFRACLARRAAAELRSNDEQWRWARHWAAVSVQRICRGCLGRRRADHLRARHLLRAAVDGDADSLRAAFLRGEDLFVVDGNGWNALMLAAASGSKRAVKVCLRNGIDPNCQDVRLRPALRMLPVLILPPPFSHFQRAGRSVLHQLCDEAPSSEGEAVLAYVLSKGGNPEVPDQEGNTPLALACSRGRIRYAAILLHMGASVDAPGRRGRAPLHLAACQARHQTLCRLLLQMGAHASPRDHEGRAPMHVLAERGGLTMLGVLTEAIGQRAATLSGASREADPRQAMQVAQVARRQAVVACVNAVDPEGRSPLHYAAAAGQRAVCAALLEYGADVDHQDAKGCVALHYAVAEGHVAVVHVLCEGDASVRPCVCAPPCPPRTRQHARPHLA